MSQQLNNEEVNNLLSQPSPEGNKKAMKELLKLFPEFADSKFYGETDKELPYLVFADFARFLKDIIEKRPQPESDEVIIKAANFMNNLYHSNNSDLKDLVLIGLFEELADEPKAVLLSKLLPSDTGYLYQSYFTKK